MKLTYKDLEKLLNFGDLEKLKGLPENEYLDAKELPYDHDESNRITDKGKYELAKDVTAFANAKGGIILMGISTEKSDPGQRIETIKDFTQLSESSINIVSYRDVLNRLTYPKLGDRVIIKKFPLKDNAKCIIAIIVPSQPKKDIPFIVSGLLENQRLSEGRFIGIFERKGDRSPSLMSIPQIHSSLQYYSTAKTAMENIGLEIRSLHERIDKLAEWVMKNGNKVVKAETRENRSEFSQSTINERIENAIIDGGYSELPSLVLSASFSNEGTVQVPNLFNPIENSPYRLVQNPPAFREYGWDLRTLDQPKPIEGKCLEVRNGNRKLLRVYRDGHILFIGLGTEEFLGWGTKNESAWGVQTKVNDNSITMNTLAVAETITNFTHFTQLLRAYLQPIPQKLSIKMIIRNPKKQPMKLLWIINNMFNELKGEFDKEMKIKDLDYEFADTLDIGFINIATDILKEFSYTFGLTDDDITYLKDVDGIKVIDRERFR